MLQYQERRKMGGEKFHAAAVPITFSTAQLTLTMHPNEIREGSFTIYCRSGNSVNGFISSNRLCMECLTESFSGSREVISYRFDASPFTAGDSVEGFFRVISNHGETRLPFSVKIVPVPVESSLGPIRNLYHFTNLARSSWKEAVEKFYDPAFASVFTAAEKKEFGIYRGLSGNKGNEQNVEEFLISIGKKDAMEYIVSVKDIMKDIPAPETSPIVDRIMIRKNGWGYTKAEVAVSGGFIQTDREELGTRDFPDGNCTLAYRIDPSKLHGGKNLGSIEIRSPYQTITIPVTVHYCMNTQLQTARLRQAGQALVRMMQNYELYRAGRMEAKEALSQIGSCIRTLQDNDRDNPLTQLYRIHFLLTTGRQDEAIWELKTLNEKLFGKSRHDYNTRKSTHEDDTIYAYRMYLTVLCAEKTEGDSSYLSGVISDALRGIEYMYNGNPGNWWITWVLLYAGDEFRTKPFEALAELKAAYENGWRSPLIYIEALDLIERSPSMLHELGDFETHLLFYAAKHGRITLALMAQINYLAKRQKSFSQLLFRILEMAYKEEKLIALRSEMLETICTLLIRGNLSDTKYFDWYKKGVDRQFPITRLYEYYMLSLPEDFEEEIPQVVLMYFAYQSTLPYEKNAVLYRYILEHRNEYSILYEQYRNTIDAFMIDQLMQQRIDSNLAYLYERYLTSGKLLTKEIAAAALPTVFTSIIRTNDKRAQRAVLIYDKCRSEQYYPIRNGICCIPVYGEDVHIFFEDKAGSRFCGSITYLYDRIMDYKTIAEKLSIYGVSSFGYDLYLSDKSVTFYDITEENHENYRRLCDSDELTDRVRQDLRMDLLHFYKNKDLVKEMDAFLAVCRPERLTAGDRSELIGYMAERELDEKAMEWIRRYGSFSVDGRTLMKLCAQTLKKSDSAGDAGFAEIVHEAFLKGCYDEELLLYMENEFDGLSEELEEVREAAVNFGTDDYILCRRMLIQMLYSGKMIPQRQEVIGRYLKGGADQEVLADVLAQSSHMDFVCGEKMEQFQLDLVAKYGLEGVPIVDICRIAWLKNRSERAGEISNTDREVTALFLADLMDRGIVFPFFRQFIGVLPELQAYADETLVEYRASGNNPDAHVLYHYAMERGGVREKYTAREMKEMYKGVYVTGFLLFFGEQMHYYITDDAAEKNIVESGTIGQDARIPEETDDRFGLINRISMLTALGRDEEALERIERYARKSYAADRIFADAASTESKG